MQTIVNGNRITDRDSLHALLRSKLQLPEDCGRNLDAVYDLLTEPGKKRIITVKHEAQLRRQLGDYADRFLQMLEDAARSGHIQLIRK